ncbi:MAG TPA: peptidylprolyl isomerase [Candidatus Binatia bacterium]|nr:peptidylprolyl isomerase [Candidatus Binatia bacterium]
MVRRLLALGALTTLLAGCGMTVPGWVPWLGTKTPAPEPAAAVAAPAPANPNLLESPKPGDIRQRSVEENDEVSDRIIAVVNNDAITMNELIESIVMYRSENRSGGPSDDELRKESLSRLIDNRLQLQEADREKITVDDAELNEEFLDRIKRYNVKNEEEFEKILKAQGVTLDSIKKRLRDGLKVSKLVRRKVAMRISVTEDEITQYLEENRGKLETGLSYHARHILITPEGDTDSGWEAARIKATMLRAQLADGADFVELAKQHSRDATAKDGGDLGTLKRGELSQEVEGAILALKPGQLSPPFKSPLGYHIFRLESKEGLEGDGLVRIRNQIRDILFRQKYETRQEAWLKEIKQRAIIEVRM